MIEALTVTEVAGVTEGFERLTVIVTLAPNAGVEPQPAQIVGDGEPGLPRADHDNGGVGGAVGHATTIAGCRPPFRGSAEWRHRAA